MYNDSNFVFVDPHSLASPTLVDVNGDGHIEVFLFDNGILQRHIDADFYADKFRF
jgi:hypothetical protein